MTSEPPADPVQRRVAVIPLVVAVIALVAFAVVITIVITLATSSAPGSSAQKPAPTSIRTESESESESADAAPESSVVAPSTPSTGARCVDSTGEVDELDIHEVSLSHDDRGDLTVEFTLASAVPVGPSHLGIYAQDAKGDRFYRFSIELESGEVAHVTAYDFDRDSSDKVDADDAEVSGKTIRFEIPHKTAKKLGEDWEWSAFTALDDGAVDSCPDDPGSSDTLTFDQTASSSGNFDRDD